tara:strand:+ start:309 stop:455 length:147 start_codon:yes stop_codon:yes gene_type:complete
MKILRIDLQTDDVSVYDSKEQLRICNMFDWDYKVISNKQAKEYEEEYK